MKALSLRDQLKLRVDQHESRVQTWRHFVSKVQASPDRYRIQYDRNLSFEVLIKLNEGWVSMYRSNGWHPTEGREFSLAH